MCHVFFDFVTAKTYPVHDLMPGKAGKLAQTA